MSAIQPRPPVVVNIQPAQTLAESGQMLAQHAVSADSSLYADLSAARATRSLSKLEKFLRLSASVPNALAKAAFIGNRGGGKSTYLLHLEAQLEHENLFTPIHIYLDQSLEGDCTYSDLFLWMVDELTREFERRGHPVDDAELAKVTLWFAETTIKDITDWKKDIGFMAQADARGQAGLPGVFSIKLLARIKSMIVGSRESRVAIRREVQKYASELCARVNAFLDHAREVLEKAGKPARLLIVQDNLDRLRGDVAKTLFIDGGEMLTRLDADLIYTAPLPLNLGANDIRLTFGPHIFTMPNVKVRHRDGTVHEPGIDGLLDLVGRRMAIALVFDDVGVARYLVEQSGGSIRDLIRLLDDAQLEAQVDDKERIDHVSAQRAVKNLRQNFVRHLLPGSVYYPILAEVHRTKCEYNLPEGEATRERVDSARSFFSDLINNGVVLEYNGDDSWYDVHPVIHEIDRFQDASRQPPPQPPVGF